MRKIIRQAQNRAKALEIRLEEENNNQYYVILAGMTTQNNCPTGLCESAIGGRQDYTMPENEAFHCFPFNNYNEGRSLFEALSHQYVVE